jgi:CHASE2 domain-containing sensor protein
MEEGNRNLRIVIIVALVIGSLVALSILFAVLGWWQVIFR